jgi:type I restriction enzyme M protein
MVLKKNKQDNSILFIDASEEFVRSGNKNKLTLENQQKILDAYIARKDIDHFAKLVNNQIIAQNDYNIAVSSYVAQKDTKEEIDILKLNEEIKRIVARQNELRRAIDEIVEELER